MSHVGKWYSEMDTVNKSNHCKYILDYSGIGGHDSYGQPQLTDITFVCVGIGNTDDYVNFYQENRKIHTIITAYPVKNPDEISMLNRKAFKIIFGEYTK